MRPPDRLRDCRLATRCVQCVVRRSFAATAPRQPRRAKSSSPPSTHTLPLPQASSCAVVMSEYSFTYVLIPADTDRPPSELSASTTDFGDALSTILKSSFAGGEVKNADSLRAEYGSRSTRTCKAQPRCKTGPGGGVRLVRPPRRRGRDTGHPLLFYEMGVLAIQPTTAPRSLPHRAASTSSLPFSATSTLAASPPPSPMRNVNLSCRSSIRRLSAGAVGKHAVSNGDGGLREGGKAATAEATGRGREEGAAEQASHWSRQVRVRTNILRRPMTSR